MDGSLTTTETNPSNLTIVQNTFLNPFLVSGDKRENNAAKIPSLATNVLSQSATKLPSLQTLINFPKSLIKDNKRPPIKQVVPGTKRHRKASEGDVQTNSIRKYLAKLT